ncbi:NUDIX domain-containing protein [Streptomyces blastmyceticus]|uniref:Nudix hydrolase domain-containing protein n=1 Tax=Streptomyces blastmyceticus TaxID=68180 RepID=A0ABN0WWN0_9ACTN
MTGAFAWLHEGILVPEGGVRPHHAVFGVVDAATLIARLRPEEEKLANQWVPPEQYVKTLPMHAAYACLFFTDTEGRPLQLHSSLAQHSGRWQWPGGNTDAEGESPFETAVRECREETGIVFTGRPRMLAVFWHSPGQWPVAKIGFAFDGGRLTAEDIARITLDPDEHDGFAVRSMAEWAETLDKRTWERLVAVNDARRQRTVAYLEVRPDGVR